MVKFKDFSMPLSVFKYFSRQISFSRTFQDSHVYLSTFQACANPVLHIIIVVAPIWCVFFEFGLCFVVRLLVFFLA